MENVQRRTMDIIIVVYLTGINLLGLLLMMADKRKARRNRWRIPERTLFLTAIFWRKHWHPLGHVSVPPQNQAQKLHPGYPAILLVQVLLTATLLAGGCARTRDDTAAKLVESELSLVKDLDEATIKNFISYENLITAPGAAGTIGDEATEAVRSFFKQFDYQITVENVDGDTAVIQADITNIDAKALARDLRTTILTDTLAIHKQKTLPADLNGYYILLNEALENNSYQLVTTTAEFRLQKQEGGWVIESSKKLEDELVGGFITYMNDPYLLSAEEVLTIYLDEFQSLSAEEWGEYLQISDLFATYSNYASLIDEAFLSQIAGNFAYVIDSCTENGKSASAKIRLTSVDMCAVLSAYKEQLLSYADTTASMRATTSELTDETAKLLYNILADNTAAAETELELTLTNNGSSWELVITDEFTNAILGNIDQAMEIFQ